MISKELLSEVLGIKVEQIKDVMDSKLYFNNTEHGDYVNIYELAHKCKEWAFLKWYDIFSCIDHSFDNDENHVWVGYAYLVNIKDKEQIMNPYKGIEFEGITEPEAIFKACQWLLDNKGIR